MQKDGLICIRWCIVPIFCFPMWLLWGNRVSIEMRGNRAVVPFWPDCSLLRRKLPLPIHQSLFFLRSRSLHQHKDPTASLWPWFIHQPPPEEQSLLRQSPRWVDVLSIRSWLEIDEKTESDISWKLTAYEKYHSSLLTNLHIFIILSSIICNPIWKD